MATSIISILNPFAILNQSSNEKGKRKRKADALGRLVESSTVGDSDQTHNDTAKLAGRGSIDGWTSCPLCGKYSKKKYALGRGIAAHLHAIHTPWKPTKLSRKIARRQREEQERQNRNQDNLNAKRQKVSETNKSNNMNSSSWTPTQAEIEAWDSEVLQILSQVEQQARDSKIFEGDSTSIDVRSTLQNLDRTGKQTSSYRDSIPVFLKAAAEGDLNKLKDMVSNSENKTSVQRLLDTNDRHLSTAEHWAAGGGHLECLMFLSDMRRIHCDASEVNSVAIEVKTVRRRDGKTCLHYAARNGHLECVEYLIHTAKYAIDEASGEGTTPFHMACYGGHLNVVKFFAEQAANVHATNEWGCDAFQFVGLTISKSTGEIRGLCNYLKYQLSVNLIRSQKQGHSILHKAAQKGNLHVIQWVADDSMGGGAGLSAEEKKQVGSPDVGGYTPSQIWRKFNDDSQVAAWMETLGW